MWPFHLYFGIMTIAGSDVQEFSQLRMHTQFACILHLGTQKHRQRVSATAVEEHRLREAGQSARRSLPVSSQL